MRLTDASVSCELVLKIHPNRLHSKWTWFWGSWTEPYPGCFWLIFNEKPNHQIMNHRCASLSLWAESHDEPWIWWQTFVVSTIWIRIGVLIVALQITIANTHHTRLSSLSVSLSPHFLPSLSRFSICPASQGNCCPSTYRFRAKILSQDKPVCIGQVRLGSA